MLHPQSKLQLFVDATLWAFDAGGFECGLLHLIFRLAALRLHSFTTHLTTLHFDIAWSMEKYDFKVSDAATFGFGTSEAPSVGCFIKLSCWPLPGRPYGFNFHPPHNPPFFALEVAWEKPFRSKFLTQGRR